MPVANVWVEEAEERYDMPEDVSRSTKCLVSWVDSVNTTSPSVHTTAYPAYGTSRHVFELGPYHRPQLRLWDYSASCVHCPVLMQVIPQRRVAEPLMVGLAGLAPDGVESALAGCRMAPASVVRPGICRC
jgi:hypothetical protein